MEFDLATESGVYGDPGDPSEEYFRVRAEKEDFSIVFEKAIDSTYDVTVKRPANLDADEFMENISQDPEVYPNSQLYVVPEFPIGDQNFEETTWMMYRTRPLSERKEDAIVDVSLDEQMNDEKVRWVNKKKEGTADNYSAELWYIGTELRERPVIDHLSQEPLDEDRLEEVFKEAKDLIDEYSFRMR